MPRGNGILETSSVAGKLFAFLTFLPWSGITLLLGFPLQTHQSSPVGQQNRWQVARCHLFPGRRANARQRLRLGWKHAPEPVSGSTWLIRKGSGRSLLREGGLKHVPPLPCFRGGRVSCGHQEDHAFPSTAAVPSASGEGVKCCWRCSPPVPLPEGN